MRPSGLGDHDRDPDLAHHQIGLRNDRDRGHVGMVRQHRFDLDRIHVVAAADVHLLGAADEPKAALLVEPTEVARPDVAICA